MSSSPSAAARVFGTTELLEQIILEVMQTCKDCESGHKGPKQMSLEHARKSFFTDGFALKRVSRDFNETINGSIAIEDKLLIPRCPEHLSWLDPSRHRIWWMVITSDLIKSVDMSVCRLSIRRLDDPKRRELFASEAGASWRKITCLQRGAEPIIIELEEANGSSVMPSPRSKKLQIDGKFTLEELYEEMRAMNHDKRVS